MSVHGCALKDGMDIQGESVQTTFVKSTKECAHVCSQTPKCDSFWCWTSDNASGGVTKSCRLMRNGKYRRAPDKTAGICQKSGSKISLGFTLFNNPFLVPTLPIRPTTKRTTTQKTQKRVTVRRTTRKPPTKKPDDVRRPIDKGGDVKKGSLPSWISIPIVFAVLAALIAFFIVRRRRSQSSIESPKEKSEDENQNIERRKSLSDIESGDPSTSKSELNESRAKFQELKDKFNKPSDQQERPGPP